MEMLGTRFYNTHRHSKIEHFCTIGSRCLAHSSWYFGTGGPSHVLAMIFTAMGNNSTQGSANFEMARLLNGRRPVQGSRLLSKLRPGPYALTSSFNCSVCQCGQTCTENCCSRCASALLEADWELDRSGPHA